jgi:hypothetical protein
MASRYDSQQKRRVKIMNHIALKVLAAAALVTLSTVAVAQDPPVTGSVKISARQDAAYRLAPQEFYAYEQRYLLANGMSLTLQEKRHHYYTQLYNQQPVEIYPVAPGIFVTAQGTRLEFDGEGDTIAITHLDRLPYAGTLTLQTDQVYFARR